MILAYLLFNAVIYAGFAVWCTIFPERTASAVGFQFRSGSGKSEYIAVYGGMELAMAAFFLAASLEPRYQEAGLLFAVLLYAGLVVFRSYTLATVSGIERTTHVLAGLELALGMAGAALWWTR